MSLDPGFIWTAFLSLFKALPNTLYITIVSVFVGFIIGTAIALIRIYRIPVLYPLASAYVLFIRGTPMLMHLLLIYFGLPIIIDGLASALGLGFNSTVIPLIGFAYISFSITAGAYMSEVVRAGILSVNRGQMEAAYSIGMTTPQALRRIVLPQALAVCLPNLSNNLIGMLHGSTLAFTVSVVEINAQAQIVAATNWKFLEAYIAAAVLFWGMTILIEQATAWLERRINKYNRGGVA
ncbi:L-cystine transport system permease protein [Paenibacillus algorifonticola]|uniref:L-cystine transport system permease protein n=1 Tax=Paenibacillus algorifonticola TaxID=684063 RepID=A0A1I2G1X1_9BACL|nr:amino acid ABC transporter permease [Paenibacillus algorifonticola]SFF10970.1 L-cystine transport system permease protein [Paenibacillus algorifonticola]